MMIVDDADQDFDYPDDPFLNAGEIIPLELPYHNQEVAKKSTMYRMSDMARPNKSNHLEVPEP